MRLSGFAEGEARRFLDASDLRESLSANEQDRLIDLTDRQPLWLALAVELPAGQRRAAGDEGHEPALPVRT